MDLRSTTNVQYHDAQLVFLQAILKEHILHLDVIIQVNADTPSPMFPKKMWKDIRGFTVIVITSFMIGMCYYSAAVLWPLQITRLYTIDDIKIGAWAGANGYPAVFALLASSLYFFFKRYNVIFTLSTLLLTVAGGCQAIVSKSWLEQIHKIWLREMG